MHPARLLFALQAVDHRLFVALRRAQGRIAGHRRLISRSADGHAYVLVGIIIALSPVGGADFAKHAVLAFAMERGVYWPLKNLLRRQRPAKTLPDCVSDIIAADEFSFPSGHSSAAFLFATLVTLYFWPLGLCLYLWAIAVGLSRVYLGVHFPLDAAVGALLGISIALSSDAVFS